MSEIANKDIDYRALRMIVGLIAVSIAIVCTGLFWFHTGKGVIPTSISVTYHFGARDFFVGALFAVGGFLLAYKGWTTTELWLAKIAGICAILIAVCPTSVDLDWVEPAQLPFDATQCKVCEAVKDLSKMESAQTAGTNDELKEATRKCITTGSRFTPVIHGTSAFLLIGILFYYCVGFGYRVYKKIKKKPDLQRLKWRLGVYAVCATSMALSAGVGGYMIYDGSDSNSTVVFWVEFVCLMAFGISWIVASKRAWLFSYEKDVEEKVDEEVSHGEFNRASEEKLSEKVK